MQYAYHVVESYILDVLERLPNDLDILQRDTLGMGVKPTLAPLPDPLPISVPETRPSGRPKGPKVGVPEVLDGTGSE